MQSNQNSPERKELEKAAEKVFSSPELTRAFLHRLKRRKNMDLCFEEDIPTLMKECIEESPQKTSLLGHPVQFDNQ